MESAKPAQTRVLVADDAVVTRVRLTELLGEVAGVEPTGCPADPCNVRCWFRQTRPRCVVIDIQLRDPSGLQLLRQLRHEDPACLLVALTSQKDIEVRQHILRAGVDHLLDKNTEFERILDYVLALGEKP